MPFMLVVCVMSIFAKLFMLMDDGDLPAPVSEQIGKRGLDTTRVAEVKGHVDAKSFDTVGRGILDQVLCSLGLPAWCRHVYFEYHAPFSSTVQGGRRSG